MRSMNWVLATAAAQLCTFGTIATLIAGCSGSSGRPTQSDVGSSGNRRPAISMTVTTATGTFVVDETATTVVGGTATIMAQASDPDGDRMTWTLALDVDQPFSPAEGTFNPSGGSGGNISSTFTASKTGRSFIKLSVFDAQTVAEQRIRIIVLSRD